MVVGRRKKRFFESGFMSGDTRTLPRYLEARNFGKKKKGSPDRPHGRNVVLQVDQFPPPKRGNRGYDRQRELAIPKRAQPLFASERTIAGS